MAEEEIEEFRARDAARKRRFRRRVLIGALVLVVGLLAASSSFMVEQAHRTAIACSNRFFEHPSAETSCGAAHALLLVPRLVPWTRKEALAELRRVEWEEASRGLEYRSSVAPDEDGLRRAAQALVELRGDEPTWDNGRRPTVIGELHRVGAIAEIIRHKELARDASSRTEVLQAMLSRGDLAAAASFAEKTDGVDDARYDAVALHLLRGAILCLTGKKKSGLAALRRAEKTHRHFHDFPFEEARLTRVACGDQLEPDPSALDAVDLESFQLGGKLSGRGLEDLVLGRGHVHRVSSGSAVPFVAEAIAERDHTIPELLELVAALSFDFPGASVGSPWLREDLCSVGAPDPTRYEKVARQLEGAAARTQHNEDGGARSPVDLPDDDLDAEVERSAIRLRANPYSSLRWAAWGFWIEATRIHGHQREGKQALADARRALALRPGGDTLARVVPALMRSGELAATSALLSAPQKTTEPRHRAVLDLARTLIAMHERRWHDARAIAHKLVASASLGGAARYLELAAALLAKDGAPLPRVEAPHPTGDARLLWASVFKASADKRAFDRYHMPPRDLGLSTGALPAELFVLGRAVDKGSVDVWLDRQLWARSASSDYLLTMRARAEAARWRGDAKRARLWDQRAVGVEKLVHDPRHRLLARTAGL